MGKKVTCVVCGANVEKKYIPMKEWKIEGDLCGKCYSQKISEFYPGDHVRVNLTDE